MGDPMTCLTVEVADPERNAAVRDAIGTVGQLERFGKRHDGIPYFSTLIGAVEDPDVTAKQTALGVLTRGGEYWTRSLSARQLHSAVERVLALCDRESDPTVRSRARSFFHDLASAVVNTATRSALGVDGTPNRAVADGLVETETVRRIRLTDWSVSAVRSWLLVEPVPGEAITRSRLQRILAPIVYHR